MSTYSFETVQATFSGPDGSFSIGSDAGCSEEGITTEMIEDKNKMDIGAGGQVMHSLRAGNGCRVTIRLLKTSPVNAQLSSSYNFQKAYAGNWGQNIIKISDTYRGDLEVIETAAFTRFPTVTWSKDGAINNWEFLGNMPASVLGAGQPDVNV